MFNVRLAGGHLYRKQLFTLLSLVASLMASFVLSLFPLDVLDEIWDLIESVSEGFLIYFYSFIGYFYQDGQEPKTTFHKIPKHKAVNQVKYDLFA